MTRNEMKETLYQMMKDMMAPGSARTLANAVVNIVEANGAPTDTVAPPPAAPELTVEEAESVNEIVATVAKAEAKKSKKKES